jgi:23S rRNA pseudouridine1911/1915/1917 synthase
VVEGGRFARTRYAVEARGPAATLVRAELETGRTHQVRVHLAALGHPLAGDRLYGGARAAALAARPMLHACRLRLRHPRTGQEMTFETPPPDDFTAAWERLR